MLHGIVMAGGSGTRFWPASRVTLPKQLLPLAGPTTLLEDTVGRLAGLIPNNRILVVSSSRIDRQVREQLPNIPAENIVGEPCKRDTAPCIGLAAMLVTRNDPDATMVVMPSDHVIASQEEFQSAIRQAQAIVDESPTRFVTFGIKPTYPAETFGYIECGRVISQGHGPSTVHAVATFKEKPPADIAAAYLAAGHFLWNAGIFVWRAHTILEALKQNQPDCHQRLTRIVDAWETPHQAQVFSEEFAAMKGISIDYAVLENASNVVVMNAPFSWDDLGGWSAVARQRGTDNEGNTIVGKHLGINTVHTIIHSNEDHLVVTMGLEGMLVVHTPDATLVADRNHEEAIRRVVAELENRGWSEFL